MAKRGRPPVDIRQLNNLEEKWCSALHLLRDGRSFPIEPLQSEPFPAPLPPPATKEQLRSWIKILEGDSRVDFVEGELKVEEKSPGVRPEDLLRFKRFKVQSGKRPSARDALLRLPETNEQRIARDAKLLLAGIDLEDMISALKECLEPPNVESKVEHQAAWRALWRAKRADALRGACERWKALPVVRAAMDSGGWGWKPYPYPDYVLAYGRDLFLRMKWQDPRFPKSEAPTFDKGRIDYLARGMAGIMAGISPKTAIHRLRTLKHEKGGPFWSRLPSEETEGCYCWRCSVKRGGENEEHDRGGWWLELSKFINFIISERKRKGERQ